MTNVTINAKWEVRACPVCGSTHKSRSEVSANIRAEELSFNEVRQYFIGIRSEQIFFSYHRCVGCGILFCPFYFSNPQLDALYSDMPDNLLGAEKSTAAKTQLGYFNYFRQDIGEVSTFLELGPDIGLVTKEVIEKYEPEKAFLIEPNTSMHAQLKSLSETSNIEIYRNLNEISMIDVDLTIGIHVFDHLLDPSAQISQIHKQTKNGGIIGVVVHNEASFLRKVLGKKWPPFCLQHPQLYNKKTLAETMKISGFEKLRINNSINHFSVKHLGTLAVQVTGLPNFITRILPSIDIPVMLGNQISIFRKSLWS